MQLKILFEIIFILIISASSQDFSFFYDNSKDQIYLGLENNTYSQSYSSNDILNYNNLKKKYYSSAGISRFNIEYYSCNISSVLNKPLDLIKVEYNLTEYDNTLIKEIILDLNKSNENIFPTKYKNEFIVEENKRAAKRGSENRQTIIYDTFGFTIKSIHNLNFQVSKVLLANFRNKKLNYLANLSYNVKKYIGNNTFNIYLKNMPEDFDLLIYIDLCDENWKETGEKILVVKKEFHYPNYKVEEENPNKTMIIIAITFILIGFILIILFTLLKLIFGFF